jgi:putative hydrolase of the HAD superfamily
MTESQTIQAIVFDLDDTLYPEREYVRSGYAAVADYLRKTRHHNEAFEDWLWDRFTQGKTDEAFDALNEHFSLNLEKADILELVRVYREHYPKISPFSDIPPFLEELKKRVKLGLISDGFLPAQQWKLDVLGLENQFDAVIFTESLGREYWKPSPVAFENMVQLLGVPHSACVYIADNLTKDFVAPNQLGWETVHFLRPHQVHANDEAAQDGQPKYMVRSAEELLLILFE